MNRVLIDCATRTLKRPLSRVPQQRRLATSAEQEEVGVVQTIWSVAKFASFLHCLHEYVVDISMCCGPSMLPTLNIAGDLVFLERLSPRFDWIKRGDVVICKSPTNPEQTVCKRIAAIAGEPIPQAREFTGRSDAVVPPGHIWLLGDNADNSTDSRYYGPVPAALLKGRVIFRFWPSFSFLP